MKKGDGEFLVRPHHLRSHDRAMHLLRIQFTLLLLSACASASVEEELPADGGTRIHGAIQAWDLPQQDWIDLRLKVFTHLSEDLAPQLPIGSSHSTVAFDVTRSSRGMRCTSNLTISSPAGSTVRSDGFITDGNATATVSSTTDDLLYVTLDDARDRPFRATMHCPDLAQLEVPPHIEVPEKRKNEGPPPEVPAEVVGRFAWRETNAGLHAVDSTEDGTGEKLLYRRVTHLEGGPHEFVEERFFFDYEPTHLGDVPSCVVTLTAQGDARSVSVLRLAVAQTLADDDFDPDAELVDAADFGKAVQLVDRRNGRKGIVRSLPTDEPITLAEIRAAADERATRTPDARTTPAVVGSSLPLPKLLPLLLTVGVAGVAVLVARKVTPK